MTNEDFTRRCLECGRWFDLLKDEDAIEWCYGHDCEAEEDSNG